MHSFSAMKGSQGVVMATVEILYTYCHCLVKETLFGINTV